MDLQVDIFELIMGQAKTENTFLTKIDTRNGIYHTLENVKRTLEQIRFSQPHEKRFVLFNSGLHDVDKLCSSASAEFREKHQHHSVDASMPCVDIYREMFGELVRLVGEFPAELRVFRSTTAGWLKYGNYGFGWPPNVTQPLSKSSHFVSHFNDIAFDVISKSGQDVYVSDGYWASLARPDNTEAGTLQKRGKHLVHPGMDVVVSLTMNWLLLILRRFCNDTVDVWNSDHISD